MVHMRNDLKPIGSALRQLIMKTYTRAEILDKKHLNEDDHRFKNITGSHFIFAVTFKMKVR